MKSVCKGYSEKPFFFTEIFEGASRTVVWHESPDFQNKTFRNLMEILGDRIEYLFKESTGKLKGYEQWSRISGEIRKSDVLELIREFEDWFFDDGSFQFCFREPDSDEYVAYDEHGLFFIYGMRKCEAILLGMGLENAKRKLITAEPHWVIQVKDSEEKLEQFRSRLKGKSILYNDEAEPKRSKDPT